MERNIRFFILTCQRRNDEGVWVDIDLATVFNRIGQLPLNVPTAGRYSVEVGGDAVTVMTDSVTATAVEGRIAKVRRTGLPSVERAGRIRPLDIQDDEGLFEPAHFVVFDGQFLGYEGNYYAPRAGFLPRYLREKLPDLVERASVDAIFRSDWEERLRQIGEVKLLRIRMARDMERQARLLNESLAGALRAASEAADAEDIELVLRGKPYSRARFSLTWLRTNARRFLRDEAARAGTSEFVVVAENRETGETETFDLLQEALSFTKQVRMVEEGRARTVDARSAYHAIREAYREAEGELSRFRER